VYQQEVYQQYFVTSEYSRARLNIRVDLKIVIPAGRLMKFNPVLLESPPSRISGLVLEIGGKNLPFFFPLRCSHSFKEPSDTS
jgi:hypothetical protein